MSVLCKKPANEPSLGRLHPKRPSCGKKKHLLQFMFSKLDRIVEKDAPFSIYVFKIGPNCGKRRTFFNLCFQNWTELWKKTHLLQSMFQNWTELWKKTHLFNLCFQNWTELWKKTHLFQFMFSKFDRVVEKRSTFFNLCFQNWTKLWKKTHLFQFMFSKLDRVVERTWK